MSYKDGVRANKWTKENMTKYTTMFHNKNDAELIAYVNEQKEDGKKTSEIFKAGIRALMEQEK